MTCAPVTIIVPTRNGGALFRRQLAALRALAPAPAAILVIDSESDDGTPEAAAAAGAEVQRIARKDFDHGATRQLGAERAATPLVAFLTQDAIPEPDYLGPLAAAFADPATAGASARILPFEDSSPLARRTVMASPMASPEPASIAFEREAWSRASASERRAACRFDDVASMARRELLLRFPFPRTMMGEDQAFAAAVLEAGFALRFVPKSVVRHAHEYGPGSVFARYRDDARFAASAFGTRVRRLRDVAKGIAYELREDARFLRRERAPLSEWVRAVPLRCAQVAGQWWGSRAP